jgi:hypothetical protein
MNDGHVRREDIKGIEDIPNKVRPEHFQILGKGYLSK